MRKIYLLLTAFFLVGGLQAQIIFQEDFDGIGGPTAGGAGTYTFPAGWLKRNVDNRTPAGSVAYVNEAWERREDFSFNVADSCAFSTSWYSPAGAADDWMWTPLIGPLPANSILKWNAVTYDATYPDGYSVRIMTSSQGPPTGGTGVMGNQVTNSTQVFSIAAENTVWTARQLSLSAYAGQSVYIAFRNNSNDEFLLLIDDVVVEVQNPIDAQMQLADTVTPYTLMPVNQTTPLNFNGTIRNSGINTLTGVSAQVNVFNGVTNVYSANSTAVGSLAPGVTTNWTIAPFTPSAIGNYTVQFIANQTSGLDQQTNNDTLYQYFSVLDSTYARDDGTVTSGLGIGAGNGGYIGQSFQVTNGSAPMTSVGVYYTQGYTGEKHALVIWSTNVSGVPNAIVGSTDTLLYPDDSARYYTVPVHGGPLTLAPGTYVVTAVEFDSTVQVGNCMNIYTANAGWVYWPTIPGGNWMNPEDFGSGFARSYVIRPNFGDPCLNNIITSTSTQATCLTCADGSASTSVTGTNGSVTYSWSPSGGNAATASNLTTGTYIVTITDAFCTLMDTVVVPFDTCGGFSSTSSSVASSCGICPDGSATITPVGGYGTLTYTWANSSETSGTLSGVLPGTYTVTVTDSFGCAITEQIIVNQNICGNVVITSDSTVSSCSTCADGSAWITITGNNGPVTISWSTSSTNDTITGLLPGVYTATVVDSAGCTFSIQVTVTSAICGDIAASSTSQQATCATCADGSATVTVTGDNGGLTYLWSNSQTTATMSGVLPGTYTVTVTDSAGCSVMDTVTVTYDLCSNVTITGDTTWATCGTCPDGSASVTVSGSNGPVTYLWSNGATTSTITGTLPGVYSVMITDSLGCVFYDTLTIGFVDGIGENQFPGTAFVFPNPNNGTFTLNLNMNTTADLVIEVINVLGEKVIDQRNVVFGNSNIRFDLNVPAGKYMVRLYTNEGMRIIPVVIR